MLELVLIYSVTVFLYDSDRRSGRTWELQKSSVLVLPFPVPGLAARRLSRISGSESRLFRDGFAFYKLCERCFQLFDAQRLKC